jgi:hypothetical protein
VRARLPVVAPGLAVFPAGSTVVPAGLTLVAAGAAVEVPARTAVEVPPVLLAVPAGTVVTPRFAAPLRSGVTIPSLRPPGPVGSAVAPIRLPPALGAVAASARVAAVAAPVLSRLIHRYILPAAPGSPYGGTTLPL